MFRYHKVAFLAAVILFCAFRGINDTGAKQQGSVQTQKQPTPAAAQVTLESSPESALIVEASPSILEATPVFSHDSGDKMLAAINRSMDSQSGLPAPDATGSERTLQNETSTLQYFGQTLISLAFVILLLLGFAWFARKFLLKNHTLGGGHIHHLGSYALSQKSQVHLIKVGTEHFLIGEGASTVSLISKIHGNGALETESDEILDELPEDNPRPLTSFGDRLGEWQNALEGQQVRNQVNASLLLLSGLTRRLRRKGVEGDG